MALIDKLTAIGDAIREKTGKEDLIPLSDMPSEIDAVYEKGKKEEYDDFWGNYQAYGTRSNYVNGFRSFCWVNGCYNPKFSIKVSGGNLSNAYYASVLNDTKIPIVHLGGSGSAQVFYSATFLRRIPDLTVAETTTFSQWFYNCTALEDLGLHGTIGQNGFDVHWSTKLSKDSMESIISCLSADTNGLTVTLSKTAVDNTFNNTTAIPFGFTFSYNPDWVNATFTDNGDGTVTLSGSLEYDTEFDYGDPIGPFPAGTYIISVPEVDMGYVDFYCLDPDGNKLTTEYAGDNTWALETDKDFVVKSCFYLQEGEYTDRVIAFPTIKSNEYDALIATKPNWNINLL